MKAVEGNSEFKQRVNLSSHAREVLSQDLENCAGEISKSGFYNTIISHYHTHSSATVSIEVNRRRSELKRSLSDFRGNPALDDIIKKLVFDYRRELLQNRKSHPWPKGDSELFRLNKTNFLRLYGDGKTPGLESENYDRPSAYLKELFEEFARLPASKRESVYLDALIDKINSADGHPLEITLGAKRYQFRPYRIMPDTGLTHLYVTGMSRLLDTCESREQIACFRLSNLSGNVEVRKDLARIPLTKDEQLDIQERIRKNGVQFLLTEAQTIKVRFHNNGQQLFRSKTHMRPIPVTVTEDGIYIFDCSERQAFNYFFSFGRSAEILEPEKLRTDFAANYREAMEQYEK